MKTKSILSLLSSNDVGIHLGDGPFGLEIGIVNLHLSEVTFWVAYIKEIYFDSYGCVCPKKLSRFIIKRTEYPLYSE